MRELGIGLFVMIGVISYHSFLGDYIRDSGSVPAMIAALVANGALSGAWGAMIGQWASDAYRKRRVKELEKKLSGENDNFKHITDG